MSPDFTPDEPPVETPIIVNPSNSDAQLWVAIRDALKLIGGMLVAKGAIDAGYVEMGIGLVMALGPMIYAQFKARRTVAKLTVLANAVPDSVAQIK